MKKRLLAIAITLATVITCLAGCNKPVEQPPVVKENVVLTVAGAWEDCRAIDEAAKAFNVLHPECTVKYEYLQDYYASLVKRMSGDDAVDIFFSTGIQSDSEMLPYALDLNSCDGLDLSGTFDGLIQNFTYREESGESKKLYSIPVGAEMRGLYVNKTLLSSLNIAVPTNQAELLAACETLKQNGFIPFHGNPGNFSQLLLYPWVCNLIANANDDGATFNRVNSREVGVSEVFAEPYEFLYSLVEKGYYDYKKAQTDLNLFTDATDEACAHNFLNIMQVGDSYEKVDDVGMVAFMPAAMSLDGVIEKAKEDYHSAIEYVFVPAPVSKEGGFAYLSPAHGIAINKASPKKDLAIEFLNFLFKPENNEDFCETFNAIPNTKEAFSYIKNLYVIPENHICELGQVTFDFNFYDIIRLSMTDLSKANNPKYMKDDGNGGKSLYPLSYYTDALEEKFQEK